MAQTSQCAPQIARDGADIAAFTADHFEDGMIRVRYVNKGELFDPKRACLQRHLFALPRLFVGTLTVDLNG